MTLPKNILILSPHGDDEVLGCGGTIARATQQGDYVHAVVIAMGGYAFRHSKAPVSSIVRMGEFQAAAAILGIQQMTLLYEGQEMRMDSMPQAEIVTQIDRLLDERQYDAVYFPFSGHNSDHRALHDAAFAALRLADGRKPPPMAAMYEYTFAGWTPQEPTGGKLYVDITTTIDLKVRAMLAYKSQIRHDGSPLGEDAIRALARWRGVACGVEYAELFYLQRHIINMEESL